MLPVSTIRQHAPTPRNLPFPAMAMRLGAEVLDLAPSVGTRGSELDLDPAPGVKIWCLGEALGPAPGYPELLSACNADSHSARASVEAGSDFPEEAWRNTSRYLSLTARNIYNRTDSLNWSVRRNSG